MKFIDLFSGIGGFRLALEKSKFECVFSADNDKYACETYNKNFKEYPLIDIKKLSQKKYQIMIFFVLDFHANRLVLQEREEVLMTQEELYFLILLEF